MDWLSRNFALLIGGIILLPLSLMALILWLSFGYGFAIEQSKLSHLVVPAIISYSFVYIVCFKQATKKFKLIGDYGYWDTLPIIYFVAGILLFGLG
ncbi:hypothetical protein [Pseudoalteromonas sp. GB56]